MMALNSLFLTGLFLCAAPQTYVLNTTENIWDATVEEINGDTFKDVFLLTCDELNRPLKKTLCGFVADSSGIYPPQPTVSLQLDPSIGALCFAEVDGTPPRELLALDAAGATIYRFSNSTFEETGKPRFPSLLPIGAKEPIFLKDGAVDLNGDGIDEWVIPVPTGAELRRADGLLVSMKADVSSEIRRGNSLYVVHHLPAYTSFSLNGQKTKALAFCSDEFTDFAYGPDWKEAFRFKIPLNVQEKWDSSAKLADINNDQFPDLAVTQTRGTIKLEAVSHIYIASAAFTYPDKPTATFQTKGGISSPELIDADGDKRLDVVLITIPLGFKNFVNFFIRGKLSVNAQVYLFNGKDFGEKPAFETSLTMDAPEGREQVAYAMDDFTGDGRIDIAFGQGANELAVFAGEPGGFISGTPAATVTLPAFGNARPYDLNGNKAKDLVMYHPGGKNSKRADIILF